MPTLSCSPPVRITRTGEIGLDRSDLPPSAHVLKQTVCVIPYQRVGPICLSAEVLASLERGAAAMPLSEKTERALEACYDAILVPTRWSSALQSLAESFGAASCTFFEHDRENSPAPVPMSVGHEAFAELWARNQAHAPDPHVGPYLERCTSFIRAGWASALEHNLSTEEDRRTLPFFHETARPGRREWLAMAFFSVDGGDWCFPIYRGGDRGPFTPEDARRLAKVGPYVAKIVSLAQKFAAFDVKSKLSALERVNSAALVIDATGRTTQMNLPAQNLLGADFNLFRGRPAAHDPGSNRRLQQLISSALHTAPGGAQSYAPILIDRDEAPWLLVEAMPVTAFGSDLFSSGRVILLLTDLRSPLRPDSQQLCAAFGLTAAEAKLAARLASGLGIDAAAVSIGVSRETARSQLKGVFAKTNTRRQAELAGLLARLRPS
jgi:DNA-binding CsgD family transcriptional regulator